MNQEDLNESPDLEAAVVAAELIASRTTIPFYPTGDRVVIERLAEVTQVGSIIVPDQAVEKPKEGIIVCIGDGTLIESEGYRIPCRFQLGDRVLIGQYTGYEIEINAKRYVIAREDEVLGVSLIPLTAPAPEEAPFKPLTAEQIADAQANVKNIVDDAGAAHTFVE